MTLPPVAGQPGAPRPRRSARSTWTFAARADRQDRRAGARHARRRRAIRARHRRRLRRGAARPARPLQDPRQGRVELDVVEAERRPTPPRERAERDRGRMAARWAHEIVRGRDDPAGHRADTAMAVNFTKGCYPGQELVERMDSRAAEAPRSLAPARRAGGRVRPAIRSSTPAATRSACSRPSVRHPGARLGEASSRTSASRQFCTRDAVSAAACAPLGIGVGVQRGQLRRVIERVGDARPVVARRAVGGVAAACTQ